MGDRAVKASGTAVGIGWVTTRCRSGGVLQRICRPVFSQLRIAPRLGMAGAGRRFAPHRPVWGLLAGYLAVGGPRLLLKERCRPGTCTAIRAASPGLGPVGGVLGGGAPRLGEGEWTACRAASPGSPPDDGGLVPGADPALGEEIST